MLPSWDICFSALVSSSFSSVILATSIAGRCWAIPGHCPRLCGGALNFLQFSPVSCFWWIELWQALCVVWPDPVRSLLTLSVLQRFLPLLHRTYNYSLKDCSFAARATLSASTELGVRSSEVALNQSMAVKWWGTKTQVPSLRSEQIWSVIYIPDFS